MSDTPLMETQSGRPEPVPLRASDAERERAAAVLREGAAEGRITLEELSARLELAYAARTRPELDAVVEDLPARDALRRETGRARAARWTVAVIANEARGGRWRPGEDTRALALIGDCTLDLRQAEVEGGELAVTAIAVLGDVRVVVPPGVAVELEGVALVGDKKYRVGEAPELPAGAPRVRVRAYAVVGDVTVMSEPPVSRLDHLRAALARLRGPGDRGPSPPAEGADSRD
jgi:Domain of unknown function (DUF1707)/Cell wall-active antibiotics response 4TMS YvqF